MTFSFLSDGQVQHNTIWYFFLKKLSDCGTLSLSLVGKMKIVLTSPGYDGSTIYAKNLDCIYVVTAEQGFDIKIDITVIDVEDTPNCKFDYIQVYMDFSF